MESKQIHSPEVSPVTSAEPKGHRQQLSDRLSHGLVIAELAKRGICTPAFKGKTIRQLAIMLNVPAEERDKLEAGDLVAYAARYAMEYLKSVEMIGPFDREDLKEILNLNRSGVDTFLNLHGIPLNRQSVVVKLNNLGKEQRQLLVNFICGTQPNSPAGKQNSQPTQPNSTRQLKMTGHKVHANVT